MLDMFDDPATAKSKMDTVAKLETEPTLCSPGEMRESSHYDRWIFPESASQRLVCGIPIPDYGVKYYHVDSEYDACPECRDWIFGNLLQGLGVGRGAWADGSGNYT
jgi:hypothetical protein